MTVTLMPLWLWTAGCHRDDPGGEAPTPSLPGTGTLAPASDPGTVVLHRLNRAEYDNTVRDLLGTASQPALDFPQDDQVGGWDNIANNLSMSPLHVELYELAAQELASEVVARPFETPLSFRAEGEGADVTATTGGASGSAWNLWSQGDLTTAFAAPIDGTYTLSARVWADQAGPDLAQATLGHDGFTDLTVDVSAASEGQAVVLAVDLALAAGAHSVTVSFLNDYYDPVAGEDRNLYVDWLDAFGPIDVEPGPNPLRDRWVTCDPDVIGASPCAEVALRALAAKAWRRPVTEAEVTGLMGVVDEVLADGGAFDDALEWGIVSVLLSPHFLYRVELDPDPRSPVAHPLDGYGLASRLSYFLWSSMPDDALFAAAADGFVGGPHPEGSLADADRITAEVHRMIADGRSAALIDNFGGQWLFIRAIDDAFKDPWTFPGFDDALKASMKEEMTRFFDGFVHGDRDLRELLTATEGEIDQTLAAHYGLPDPGPGWHNVDLSAVGRGGMLGQAGWLAVNAYPTRTSPVIRGKFVLGQLLCSEPPPPPPDVPALDAQADAETVREQLEAHRADPVCASCHETMDDIGFGLENFDGIGAWRDTDHGVPIDATGVISGMAFDGPRELVGVISTDPKFEACIAEQMFTYALGRLPTPSDAPYLEDVTARFAAGGYTFEALAAAIATSEPFMTRRGEP